MSNEDYQKKDSKIKGQLFDSYTFEKINQQKVNQDRKIPELIKILESCETEDQIICFINWMRKSNRYTWIYLSNARGGLDLVDLALYKIGYATFVGCHVFYPKQLPKEMCASI